METPDLFALFARPLHRTGVRYMISGSLASIFYGEPRLTMDVDIVVHLGAAEASGLRRLAWMSDIQRFAGSSCIGEVAERPSQ